MQQTRPVPGHPEFTVIDYPGYREYRVENWYIARNGTGKVVRRATGFTWHWAIVPVLFSFADSLHSRWFILMSFLTFALLVHKCTQVLEEAMLMVSYHGVQLETRRGFPGCPIFVSRRFIALTTLHDAIINEALRGWNVRYYLACVKQCPTGEFTLEVAFENMLPRLPVLLYVYHDLHDVLLGGGVNDNGNVT